MLANALYLLASRNGPLSVVVTLSSLYPASTVILARVVLGERLNAWQQAGIASRSRRRHAHRHGKCSALKPFDKPSLTPVEVQAASAIYPVQLNAALFGPLGGRNDMTVRHDTRRDVMQRVLRDLAVGAAVLLLTSALAWAQATAELNGRVTDESGAVLPGVTVTATQTDTGFTRTVVTDGTGTYSMPNLPTGPYRLEVSLQGFKTYVQTGIVLQVGATPTINAVLGVGNLEETVSVEAAAPLVDVRSAGISDVVENERIVELPLQGRQVTDLIVLAGAAVQTGVASNRAMTGGVSISVAGGLNFGVAYTLDGAMHNDVNNNANLPMPFPDALQEFSVATSGLSAQNGMHAGASVNAVTKSGTNSLHGNAFEFVRDKRFNAKDPFAAIDPATGKRKDDGLVRNQFGGTLGGPIVRDKLFFFGGYQGTNVTQTPAANITYVPTAAMLAGDFTDLRVRRVPGPRCRAARRLRRTTASARRCSVRRR